MKRYFKCINSNNRFVDLVSYEGSKPTQIIYLDENGRKRSHNHTLESIFRLEKLLEIYKNKYHGSWELIEITEKEFFVYCI